MAVNAKSIAMKGADSGIEAVLALWPDGIGMVLTGEPVPDEATARRYPKRQREQAGIRAPAPMPLQKRRGRERLDGTTIDVFLLATLLWERTHKVGATRRPPPPDAQNARPEGPAPQGANRLT